MRITLQNAVIRANELNHLDQWAAERRVTPRDIISICKDESDGYRVFYLGQEHDLAAPQYFECVCKSPEHMLRFTYVPLDNDSHPEIYIDFFMTSRGFWHRLWQGVKYVFGRKELHGHFDGFVLDLDDINRMLSVLQCYKIDMEYQDNKRKKMEGGNDARPVLDKS